MSTCTDLISAINAVVVDPNLLASVDPSTIAVLSNIGTTETIVSLGAGGAAVVSIPSSPSVDGRVMKLTVAGKVHYATTSSFQASLFLGNSTTIGSNNRLYSGANDASANSSADSNFFMDVEFVWDSASKFLSGYAHSTDTFLSSAALTGVSATSVTAQTNIQFVVSGTFSSGNAANSVTITQLKLSYV